MCAANVRLNTVSSAPLAAEMIRASNRTRYVVLKTATRFPAMKTRRATKVTRLRSACPVKYRRTGPLIPNTIAKTVISRPALPTLTPRSSATRSKIPPMISSTMPTTKAIVVSRYTRLSNTEMLLKTTFFRDLLVPCACRFGMKTLAHRGWRIGRDGSAAPGQYPVEAVATGTRQRHHNRLGTQSRQGALTYAFTGAGAGNMASGSVPVVSTAHSPSAKYASHASAEWYQFKKDSDRGEAS